MEKFREDIKDYFITELRINPFMYDELKGFTRGASDRVQYRYDQADETFVGIIHEHFRNQRSLYKTFLALYHCYDINQVRSLIAGNPGVPEEELIALDSIKTYVKRIKKDLRKIFESDDSTRRKILNQIKVEYENNLRNFEQSQSAV